MHIYCALYALGHLFFSQHQEVSSKNKFKKTKRRNNNNNKKPRTPHPPVENPSELPTALRTKVHEQDSRPFTAAPFPLQAHLTPPCSPPCSLWSRESVSLPCPPPAIAHTNPSATRTHPRRVYYNHGLFFSF